MEEKELVPTNRIDEVYLEKKQVKKSRKRRVILMNWLLRLLLVGSIALYFVSDMSKVMQISVVGNQFVQKQTILDTMGINLDSYFLFLPLDYFEKKVMELDLIKNVEITRKDHRILKIEIEEEKILGYIYLDKPYFVDEHGKLFAISKENMRAIANLPILIDFANDEALLKQTMEALAQVEEPIRKVISEIHHAPQSFDETFYELIMNDAHRVFISAQSFSKLNRYFDMSKAITKPKQCINFIDSSNSVVVTDCKDMNVKPEEIPNKDVESEQQKPPTETTPQ